MKTASLRACRTRPRLAQAVEIGVSPGGEIFGTGKYQQLDPGWVEAAGIWIEHVELDHRRP